MWAIWKKSGKTWKRRCYPFLRILLFFNGCPPTATTLFLVLPLPVHSSVIFHSETLPLEVFTADTSKSESESWCMYCPYCCLGKTKKISTVKCAFFSRIYCSRACIFRECPKSVKMMKWCYCLISIAGIGKSEKDLIVYVAKKENEKLNTFIS